MENLTDITNFPEFDNIELIAKQVVEGFIAGLHKSPFHGFSVEFAEHRIYNPGESTKFIDWKLFARSERLFVKEFEEETNLRCQLVIDTSSSMLFPYQSNGTNKLAFSVYSAASIMYLLRKQRDAVGLSLINNSLDYHSNARSSMVHSQLLYNELRKLLKPENIGLKKTTDTATLLHQLAETVHKRSLVVIFSDMFGNNDTEKLFSALQHLRYAKHEVLLFHITDKKLEQDFEFSNRPYKFVDLESGHTIKVNPNEVRGSYKELTSKYIQEIKTRCGQYQIDFIDADINANFKEVLHPYLLKRKNLY